MDSIITGVTVGVILVAVNLMVSAYKERRSKSKEAIQLLLKCILVILGALQKSELVNGDCDDVKTELEDFLIKRK